MSAGDKMNVVLNQGIWTLYGECQIEKPVRPYAIPISISRLYAKQQKHALSAGFYEKAIRLTEEQVWQ